MPLVSLDILALIGKVFLFFIELDLIRNGWVLGPRVLSLTRLNIAYCLWALSIGLRWLFATLLIGVVIAFMQPIYALGIEQAYPWAWATSVQAMTLEQQATLFIVSLPLFATSVLWVGLTVYSMGMLWKCGRQALKTNTRQQTTLSV